MSGNGKKITLKKYAVPSIFKENEKSDSVTTNPIEHFNENDTLDSIVTDSTENANDNALSQKIQDIMHDVKAIVDHFNGIKNKNEHQKSELDYLKRFSLTRMQQTVKIQR